MSIEAALDIAPLFEEHWTGIPNVVAAITEFAIKDTTLNWTFLCENIPVSNMLVEKLLAKKSGSSFLSNVADSSWKLSTIPFHKRSNITAIFPNIKSVRNFFGREASIIHDLSPLITPQFHNNENINFFSSKIRKDIETSDHIFCVSNATMNDIHSYFKKPLEQMSVIRLGASFDPVEISCARTALSTDTQIEPYILIIGTLEPRKNGRLIFDYLLQNPSLVDKYRIVFAGRDGWLNEKQKLLELLKKVGISQEKIFFTGFISEIEKISLILNAAICVYPSFFEGFGLPVLEAAILDKITVCSNSSSMPEVFPEKSIFFNPEDIFDFGEALYMADMYYQMSRLNMQSLPDLLKNNSTYDWSSCYKTISDWIKS